MKNWNHFKKHYFDTLTGVTIDYSKIKFKKNFFPDMNKRMGKALKAMKEIEAGSFANVDENRQVGHYWLRDSSLAPTQKITKEIQTSIRLIKKISKNISEGSLKGVKGKFENLLIIGIGGSALGSQFLTNALISHKKNDINVLFLDNTDPDGIELTLSNIKTQLGKTLVIVISKSGGTPETRNAMILTQHAYKQKRINFNEHAISITEKGSQLYKLSKTQKWIDTLPMWDWVGGRTSIFSAVGLLPAAIQGIDIGNLLKGAKIMDNITRDINIQKNPAAILALSWYQATGGKGKKDMVILPYKDQLMLFSKYLQQLIMESLGKGINLDGVKVSQGISVYGNKGSTDQHAYIQQLRDGINNFFVNFIEVNKQNEYSKSPFVDEHQNKAGDYLNGFFLGTQQALLEKGRESISV